MITNKEWLNLMTISAFVAIAFTDCRQHQLEQSLKQTDEIADHNASKLFSRTDALKQKVEDLKQKVEDLESKLNH